ncbi:MAG: dihydrofolate reductase family protein [Solirubrobacteraceae bacterium]
MKLTSTTWVSVDGVMQGLGAAQEDPRGGFERGGWAMPYADPEVEAALNDVYTQADAFLFGRWTFDVFAASWGTVPAMRDSAIGEALNSKPKYVASTTLANPEWAETTVLSGDLETAIGQLKAEGDGVLLVPGSRTLTRWLLETNQFDEINLFTAPVVVGQGARLFPETGPDLALELTESRATSNGVIIRTYRTNGRPQYGVTTETTSAWE